MLGKVLALSSLGAFTLLSALLQSTSPSTIHPVGILFVFILIYIVALGVSTFFVYGLHRYAVKLIPVMRSKKQLTLKGAYLYASVLALAPVMLVGVNSIGRGSIYEVLLIFVFECIACFYIAKQRS